MKIIWSNKMYKMENALEVKFVRNSYYCQKASSMNVCSFIVEMLWSWSQRFIRKKPAFNNSRYKALNGIASPVPNSHTLTHDLHIALEC